MGHNYSNADLGPHHLEDGKPVSWAEWRAQQSANVDRVDESAGAGVIDENTESQFASFLDKAGISAHPRSVIEAAYGKTLGAEDVPDLPGLLSDIDDGTIGQLPGVGKKTLEALRSVL